MEEDSKKVIPMRPLRDVLAEFDKMVDQEMSSASGDSPCIKCNGTGTELVYNEIGQVRGGKPCKH